MDTKEELQEVRSQICKLRVLQTGLGLLLRGVGLITKAGFELIRSSGLYIAVSINWAVLVVAVLMIVSQPTLGSILGPLSCLETPTSSKAQGIRSRGIRAWDQCG